MVNPSSPTAWLASTAGAAALAEAASLPDDRLTRISTLRRRYEPEFAAAAVELIELRRRGRQRFARSDEMFFTREGLEQSTGDAVAAYRAAHFPPSARILDACCGIGGDAMAFANRGPVLAVDLNPGAAQCAVQNRLLLDEPAAAMMRVVCADVTRLNLARLTSSGDVGAGIDGVFFDPSRRRDSASGDRRRARTTDEYLPPLSWLAELKSALPLAAAKVSPMADDAVLTQFGGAVEFVSDRGECKEAVIWCGPLAERLLRNTSAADVRGREPYFATVLSPYQEPATLSPFACPRPTVGATRQWLLDPNGAVVRAHLTSELAALVSGYQLDSEIAYLTTDTLPDTPFASCYQVIESMPYQPRNLQQSLRRLGARVTVVKKRGVPFEPEAVLKSLKPGGDKSVVLVLTRCEGKAIAILCEHPIRIACLSSPEAAEGVARRVAEPE